MDLLETMYKITYLTGHFTGAYAYRGTQRIGWLCRDGSDDNWAASVNWIYYEGGTDAEVKNFESEEEAKNYIETQWKIFVDAIMED